MAATVWKGYITFGLISIPVRLFTAARSERVSFHQISKESKARVRQQLWDPVLNRKVERSELVKGYEVGKDQYLIVEDEEIKKVTPASGDTMEILEFVKLEEIDPLYFDQSYFIVPEDAGKKPYHLLVKTMQESGYGAIAKISMHQREYTVVMRPKGKGLTLHTMHYENEIRAVPEYGKDTDIEIKPQELQLAKQLVESLAAPFEPKKYHEGYQERLKQLIEAKQQGLEAEATKAPRLAPVIDMMEALQKSLQTAPKKAPARSNDVHAVEANSSKKQASRKKVARK
jgi:DNA end-binding protein Ku